ncbi:MAG: M56 family metallopeptidase [Erysipelotrichales bacterium]|nr:M56 family metallopeptidase [Erysipelotrichales bacterium]
MELTARFFWALFIGVAFGLVPYWRQDDEKHFEPNKDKGQRYLVYGNPYMYPIFLIVLSLLSISQLGLENGVKGVLQICADVLVNTSIYYLLLVVFLPVLRKYLNARVCAFLWTIPSILYVTHYSHMELEKPLAIISIPNSITRPLCYIWITGFIVVMVYKCVQHLWFRHQLLEDSYYVKDAEVLEVWERELYNAGCKHEYTLAYSPSVKTPLTIGFFKSTIVVILPDKKYSKEELELILRHELVHIGREDSGVKFMMTFYCAICWFNPLMWMAVRCNSEDLELSCDETVLLNVDEHTRRKYAELVLSTAGDDRGFTTCLSAKASSMRYRLKNIMVPRKRMVGGLLVGMLAFLLIFGSGHIAFAFSQQSGHTYIFEEQAVSNYEIGNIQIYKDGNTIYYDCLDQEKFTEYLAELDMEEITGNYSFEENDTVMYVRYRNTRGVVMVKVRDHAITVTLLYENDRLYSDFFYVEEGVDWEYIYSLIIPREEVVVEELLPYPPEMKMYFGNEVNPDGQWMVASSKLNYTVEDGQVYVPEAGDILYDSGAVGGIHGVDVDKVKLQFSHDLYTGEYIVEVEDWDRENLYHVSSDEMADENVLILAPYSAHYTVYGVFTDGKVQYEMEYYFDVELP